MVINLDTTIAVTQNFASVVNLRQVWPKTVKGRPKLSKHWLKRLRAECPDAIAIIEQCAGDELEAEGDSSSDSSSSSSSSDDSSDDSGAEDVGAMSMHGKKRRLMDGSSQASPNTQCINKMRRSPE